MKSIKFTDQELELLRGLYQQELEEAENYILKVKSLLNKMGVPEPVKESEPELKIPKKRGRKPKVVKEEVVPAVIKKERKPRMVKEKPIKQEEPKVENIETPIPVKKIRKKRVTKVKPVKQKETKVEKSTTIIPIKKERKPRSDKGKNRSKPIQPIIKEEVIPQPIVSETIVPVVEEKKEIEVVPTPTLIESKPIQQPFFSNPKGSV